MAGYLLDENVLRECGRGGNARVRQWLGTVATSELHLSVMTVFEERRGAEMLRRRDPGAADAIHQKIDALEHAYASRILPLDCPVAAKWAQLLGAKEKNQRDRALAATAAVHDLVLVTRNLDHVRACGIQVLDPFAGRPSVTRT